MCPYICQFGPQWCLNLPRKLSPSLPLYSLAGAKYTTPLVNHTRSTLTQGRMRKGGGKPHKLSKSRCYSLIQQNLTFMNFPIILRIILLFLSVPMFLGTRLFLWLLSEWSACYVEHPCFIWTGVMSLWNLSSSTIQHSPWHQPDAHKTAIEWTQGSRCTCALTHFSRRQTWFKILLCWHATTSVQ